MEGPMDATGGAPERTRAGTETGGRGRPPGGKALQRLLYFLEERGYEGLADAAIESAADRDGAGLRERAEQFAARPVGGRAEAAGDPRRGVLVFDDSTTRIPFAFASSAIDAMLSSIISTVDGPVFPAMSFVPARMTTAAGLSAITSCRKRTSICGVV